MLSARGKNIRFPVKILIGRHYFLITNKKPDQHEADRVKFKTTTR
jgi:hypothetical protein